jgi:hypothetical protein
MLDVSRVKYPKQTSIVTIANEKKSASLLCIPLSRKSRISGAFYRAQWSRSAKISMLSVTGKTNFVRDPRTARSVHKDG